MGAFFMSGGGNDPTMPMALMTSPSQFFENKAALRNNVFSELLRRQAIRVVVSYGNVDEGDPIEGGGGHDPICPKCPRPFGGGGFDPGKGDNPPKDINNVEL